MARRLGVREETKEEEITNVVFSKYSIECRETKTKVTTLANHSRR